MKSRMLSGFFYKSQNDLNTRLDLRNKFSIRNGAETLSLNSSRHNSKFTEPSKFSRNYRNPRDPECFLISFKISEIARERAIKWRANNPRGKLLRWNEIWSLKIRRNKIWNLIGRNRQVSKLEIQDASILRTISRFFEKYARLFFSNFFPRLNAWNLWRDTWILRMKKKKKNLESRKIHSYKYVIFSRIREIIYLAMDG